MLSSELAVNFARTGHETMFTVDKSRAKFVWNNKIVYKWNFIDAAYCPALVAVKMVFPFFRRLAVTRTRIGGKCPMSRTKRLA